MAERERILIVCEGAKTEPNYFRAIQEKLPPRVVEVEIAGEGHNTLRLVETAQQIQTHNTGPLTPPRLPTHVSSWAVSFFAEDGSKPIFLRSTSPMTCGFAVRQAPRVKSGISTGTPPRLSLSAEHGTIALQLARSYTSMSSGSPFCRQYAQRISMMKSMPPCPPTFLAISPTLFQSGCLMPHAPWQSPRHSTTRVSPASSQVPAGGIVIEAPLRALNQIDATVGTRRHRVVLHHNRAALRRADDRRIDVALFHLSLFCHASGPYFAATNSFFATAEDENDTIFSIRSPRFMSM